ncbi:MAG: hypothetical protein RIB93_31585 [Coleofasciculus sp. D1-CHI-01]
MLKAMGAGFAVEEIDIDDIITSLGNGLKGGHEYQTNHDDKGQDQSAVRFNHHFLASFLDEEKFRRRYFYCKSITGRGAALRKKT